MERWMVMRNKTVAALLVIFLGTLGLHKFYLGRIGWYVFEHGSPTVRFSI